MEEELDSIEKQFDRAAQHVRGITDKLEQSQLLLLYGLYKQATVGSNDTPKPSFIRITDCKKWEAWKQQHGKNEHAAKTEYITAVEGLDPEFSASDETKQNASWVRVSCLSSSDVELQEADKTIFDWVKENNEERLKELLLGNVNMTVDLQSADESGMTVLHWAADRGYSHIVRLLLSAGAEHSCKDSEGQTPLHYAASCGHSDVAKLLVDAGSDIRSLDNDGCTPLELVNGQTTFFL